MHVKTVFEFSNSTSSRHGLPPLETNLQEFLAYFHVQCPDFDFPSFSRAYLICLACRDRPWPEFTMYDILAAEAKSNKCVSCELNPTPEEFLSEPQKANERDDVPHLQVRPDPQGCPRLVACTIDPSEICANFSTCSELRFVTGEAPEHVVVRGPAAECGGGGAPGQDQVRPPRRPGPDLHQHLRPPRLGHQGGDGPRGLGQDKGTN